MESIHNDIQSIALQTIGLFVLIVLLLVIASSIRSRILSKRRAALVRSIVAHPAGKALANTWNPPTERTRHIDRPGFDWTSDTL